MIIPKPGIMGIAPYVGGESKAANAQRIIKLSSNEGAFGPSPLAIKALQNMAPHMHRYPDGGCEALRDRLASMHGIRKDGIVCGNGSDEIITFLVQAYAGAGDEVLYSAHGFLMYGITAHAFGATPITAPETELKADADALLAAVTGQTKIVFLANPNNPTGTMWTNDDVVAFRKALREDILLVLDCAYAEYVTDPAYLDGGLELADRFDNVVVTRTFSKAYGMAGLRLGWGYCPPAIADVLNRVRGPFNVSSAAQIAGLAALEDVDFLRKVVEHNTHIREKCARGLEEMGLRVIASQGNFLLVDFGKAERAEDCRLSLKADGILVRQVGSYGLPGCLRLSLGTDEEMALTLAGIKAYMNG